MGRTSRNVMIDETQIRRRSRILHLFLTRADLEILTLL
ncbi:hypothetical protein BSY16_6286 (plasmid) [Sinorhizobium sp. RAC02]|nr:hypothetical protein BSY16_6286 [Sinorhizobium sp. RAC02]